MRHPFGKTAFFLTIPSVLKTAGSIHGHEGSCVKSGQMSGAFLP
jgi:hypothetical protein